MGPTYLLDMFQFANTSNLWAHLRSHHKELYESAKKQQSETQLESSTLVQPTVVNMFQIQRKWANSDDKSKQIDKLITEMIITDNQPFTVVSDVGFQHVVPGLNPRYALKSEKFYRTEKVPEIHTKVVHKIKALIQPKNAGFPLSFTTDCWSGPTESLMSLTCHFIDKDWVRKQVLLNTTVMEGSHTGDYIKEKFLGMLEQWNIARDRVGLVLHDNGANMVKGMRLAEVPDLSCTAHQLQLVIHDGLACQRAVIDTIAMVKTCVTHFQHSVLAKDHLQKIQKELGLPEHQLIQAVPTRWNSTLHMLQRALEQKRALTVYSGEYGGFSAPSAHQWELASNLVETLIPMEEATLDVSSSSFSASSIIPCVNVLKMLLQDEGPTTVGIKTLRQGMSESLIKRFAKLEETKHVVLACLLDPRYKNYAFSSDHTLVKAKQWLKDDVEGALTEACNDEGTSAQEVDVEQVAEAEEEIPEHQAQKKQRRHDAPSGSRIDAMFSSLLGPHTGEASASHTLDEELRVYLMEPIIGRRMGDPLQWWKQHENRFKLLSKQARKFLCAPPSSVPSERVFIQPLPALQPGQHINIKLNGGKRMEDSCKVIAKAPELRSYYVQTEQGMVTRRNRRHIQEVPESSGQATTPETSDLSHDSPDNTGSPPLSPGAPSL
ncbi:zinc finger BED domain-containing protein 4-like [Neoarius graeffei]|uniref:zinc finger BED domain-containing protein 4-like n=1 Tax=Neoarius graeffei TaxID=443677 RepID=UPI00298C141E|nr:zinc finger BED domain-containing protein 4-like [Neoarius graeffei]